MVEAVNQGDADRRAPQLLGGREAGEPTTDDHHVGAVAHRCMVSRRQRANEMTSSAGGTADSSPYAVYIRHRR